MLLAHLLVPPPERRIPSEGLGKIFAAVSERLPKNRGVRILIDQLICLFSAAFTGCTPQS